MAITILQQPQAYNPARCPTVFLLSSTNSTKAGFSYTARMFDAYTGELFYSYNPPKMPTGHGVIDLSPIVRSYIQHDIVPGATGFTSGVGYFKAVELMLGERQDSFSFTDSYYHGGSGRVMFSGSDFHDFVVGQKVTIRQTAPFLYSEWEGTQTVMDVIDDHAFTIDHGFQSGPTTPGTASHADGASISFTGMTGTTCIVAGYSFPREEFTSWDSEDWIPDGSNPGCGLLCNAPDGFRIRSDAQMMIPVPNNSHNRYLRITTKDKNNNTLGVYGIQSAFSSLSDEEIDFVYAPVGPYNITNAPAHNTWTGATSPIFGTGVTHYYVGFMDSSSNAPDAIINTRELRLDIDTRCVPFEKFTVIFADKKGAWTSWEFGFRSEENNSIDKETFYKGAYGELQGNTWAFKDQRRGTEVMHADHKKSFVVRSNAMTDAESRYFSELKSASHIYWVKSPNVFLPIVLEDDKWERLQWEQEEEEIRYELTFRLAYGENTLI